jgi:sterol desaturase/sphingolipid hydroxylase (fatty acid hydroxylase superfamily)
MAVGGVNVLIEAIQLIFDTKVAAVLTALLLLMACERLAPAARPLSALLQKSAARGWRIAKNLGFGGVNAVVSWLIVVPVSALAATWALDWRPAWLACMPGLVLDLFILDLWIYWWHRANHVVPFLWRFHMVHHLDEFLDATSALRFHAGEVVLSAAARAGVIYVLDIALASVFIFETLVAIFTMFHHSNVRLLERLERPLSLLIVTPSIHWVHHHAIRRDTDSNYSTVLSVWDRLFATRSSTVRTPDMPIGVERRYDLPFLRLIVQPAKGDIETR